MRPMLWLVLTLAIIGNAFVSLMASGGAEQVLLSVGTGLVAVASIAGLVVTYRRSSSRR